MFQPSCTWSSNLPKTIPKTNIMNLAYGFKNQNYVSAKYYLTFCLTVLQNLKKSGEIKVCIDARKVNSRIILDRKCPMRIEDI